MDQLYSDKQAAEERHQKEVERLMEQLACVKSALSKATRMADEAHQSEHKQRHEFERSIDALADAKQGERAAHEAKDVLNKAMQHLQHDNDELRIKLAVAEEEARVAKKQAGEKVAELETKCEDLLSKVSTVQKTQIIDYKSTERKSYSVSVAPSDGARTR